MEPTMEIPTRLLDILVCPLCKTQVTVLDGASGLKCRTCRRVYTVRDNIPCMLPEEATLALE